MERMTAKQARELAGKTSSEVVDDILVAIKKAASEKKRQLRTGWEYKDDQDVWVQGGYDSSPRWTEAKKQLEDLGYKVEFYYNDGSIAVDMYTLIKW